MKKITDKDKKDWQNFTSGKDKIEDKDNFNIQSEEKEFLKSIDLHGYTLEQANKTISHFIEKCYGEGVNRINVITGKGSRSKNKEDPFKSYDLAILKYSVPDFIKNKNAIQHNPTFKHSYKKNRRGEISIQTIQNKVEETIV